MTTLDVQKPISVKLLQLTCPPQEAWRHARSILVRMTSISVNGRGEGARYSLCADRRTA